MPNNKKKMNKVFKTGDHVALKDDVISGIVVDVLTNDVVVRTSDGFDMTFPSHLLVIENQDSFLKSLSNMSSPDSGEWEEKYESKRKATVQKSKNRAIPPMEVDLHINQLTNSTRGMTNFDMLTLQINTAKLKLEFAIQKKIGAVVFIHGVGEGVLKEELMFLFGRYSGLEYFDAPYAKYGVGATQVEISQNAKLI